VALFGPGAYRLDPIGTVVGLDSPLLLRLKAGDEIKLVWQKVAR